jgi:hypothetical protein
MPFPPDAAPARRLAFIDNLRWSAISMEVVMHAAVTYSPFGSWYVREHPPLGLGAMAAFATYQSFQHAVSMGLLFGIAGSFAAGAVVRRGPARFLRERAVRLGVPLLLYVVLIGPLTEYYVAGNWRGPGFAAAWWRHATSGELLSESGPLWFCLVLLLFSAVFAALTAWRPPTPDAPPRPVPATASILGFTAAMAVASFALAWAVPRDRAILNVDLHDLPQYPMMFAVGVLAGRNGWLSRIDDASGRRWLFGGLAGSAALWAVLVLFGGGLEGRLDVYEGGWHWQAAGMALWRSFTCVALSLGLVTLYRRRFDGQGPLARFLTRNSFGVYVAHAPILIVVTRLLHSAPLETGLKFGAASLLAIAGSFLFVGFVLQRLPGARMIV